MDAPRIGITTSYSDGRQMIDHTYISAVEAAGGLPLIVPMFATEAAARDFASLLDGLIITGGPGITTGLIGDLPEDLPSVDPVRDTGDRLIYAAMEDRPVLGICYGMQFINAQAGGTIYADVMAQQSDVISHSPSRGSQDHTLRLMPGSHLHHLFGRDELMVNTYHIQAVAAVGAGLQATGYGPDGVIEAIESDDRRLIGVQFHPERMGVDAQPLFEDFVARCRR